jgi:hypothetical protein
LLYTLSLPDALPIWAAAFNQPLNNWNVLRAAESGGMDSMFDGATAMEEKNKPSVENYNRYLQHLDIEDLEGLEFDCYVPWVPGDVIVFPREQLHAASSGVLPKLGVSVFTNRIQ